MKPEEPESYQKRTHRRREARKMAVEAETIDSDGDCLSFLELEGTLNDTSVRILLDSGGSTDFIGKKR